MEHDEAVGVQVPGSAANLGPGFDCLAAALDLHLTVWTVEREDRRVVSSGEGAGELPEDDANLVWRTFVAYCARFAVAVPDVSLRAHNDIPLERGLGSSAAAAVAGVALARAVTRAGGRDADLVEIAAAVEGHADNAAAAVIGGIVAVVDRRAHRFEPAPGLRPVTCVPATRQSTSSARTRLPESVSLAEAADNGGRAALVLAGLSGAAALHPATMRDVLHEPARFEMMPASGGLVHNLRAAGYAACLSGAGPTVLVVAPVGRDAVVEDITAIAGDSWTVRGAAWDLAGASVCPPTIALAPS